MPDQSKTEKLEARIRQEMSGIPEAHAATVKPGMNKTEQMVSCMNLVDSMRDLTQDLILYDQIVEPGSKLMNEAVRTLEAHEPPDACKGVKPSTKPRLQT